MIDTHLRKLQVFTLLCLCIIGGAAVNILPFIFSSFSQVYDVSTSSSLTTAELVGIFITGISFKYWRNSFSLKQALFIGLVLFIAGTAYTLSLSNLFSEGTGSLNSNLAARFVSGIGAGILTAHAFSIIGAHKNPEPLFALVLFAQVLWSAIASFAMPMLNEVGSLMSFSFLLVCALLTLLPVLIWLPTPEKSQQSEEIEDFQSSPLLSRLKALVVVSTILWYMALGLFWADSADRGTEMGLSVAFISSVFAAGYLASLTGNGIAIYLANRFDRRYPMLIAGLVHLMVYFMFYLSTGPEDRWIYTVAVLVYSISWAIFTPFQLGLYSEFSIDGRFSAIFLPATVVGMTFGTQANGLLNEDGKMILATFLLAICLICYAYILKQLPAFYQELKQQYGPDALNDESYSQV